MKLELLGLICFFEFSFCSPTEEKLASKSKPLSYDQLDDCVNNSKKLNEEFWVSAVDLTDYSTCTLSITEYTIS